MNPTPGSDRQPHNTLDAVGTVRVVVFLKRRGGSGAQRGNIVRTVSVAQAKVSEVSERVKRLFFPKSP